MVTFWTAIVVTLAQAFKSEELLRGFRLCESDYYDLTRQLLDCPAKDEKAREAQGDAYLERVYRIQQFGGHVEANSPMSAIR
jgi:hypothetical protein